MGRCLRFFEGMGVRVERVMTDNGPGYRSGEFNALLESEGARHVYTRAYSPWQNGKVERMNRTLAQEWQYARAWDGEAGRASALPAFIEHYNWERPHSACGGLPPMSRIVGVNNLFVVGGDEPGLCIHVADAAGKSRARIVIGKNRVEVVYTGITNKIGTTDLTGVHKHIVLARMLKHQRFDLRIARVVGREAVIGVEGIGSKERFIGINLIQNVVGDESRRILTITTKHTAQ